jgi:hypothetical protein
MEEGKEGTFPETQPENYHNPHGSSGKTEIYFSGVKVLIPGLNFTSANSTAYVI